MTNDSLIEDIKEEMQAAVHLSSGGDDGLTYIDGLLKAIAIIRRHNAAPPVIAGGKTTSRRIEPADMANNHLARELGNQKRFLYEYGYSQIVDILDKAGFLKQPNQPRDRVINE